MIAEKPYRFPNAVFVSTARRIQSLIVSALCLSVWQVNIVTATRSRKVSILELKKAAISESYLKGLDQLFYKYLSITSIRKDRPCGKKHNSSPEAVLSKPSICTASSIKKCKSTFVM